jgi:hypothetical protein
MVNERISPARVLRLIRDAEAKTYHDLSEAISKEIGQPGRPLVGENNHWLYYVVHQLIDAELINMEDHSEKLSVTPTWMRIQNLLGINLTRDVGIGEGAMLIKPVFGVPDHSQRADVFVAMPFKDIPRAVYTEHITPVVQSLGLSVLRADDFFGAHAILTDIWNAINGCRAVIADCTNRNANVFYEIGIAHTLGRPVILITQTLDDVPFDIRHLRTFRYEYTPPGMKSFERELSRAITATLNPSG